MAFLSLAATMITSCRRSSNLNTDAKEIAQSISRLCFQPRALGFVSNHPANFTLKVYIVRSMAFIFLGRFESYAILLTLLTLFSSNHHLYSFSGSVRFNVVDILIFIEDTSGRTAFSNSKLYNNVLSTLSKVGTPSFFYCFVLGAFILPDSFYVSF